MLCSHYQTTYCADNVRKIYILMNWLGLKGLNSHEAKDGVIIFFPESHPALVNIRALCISSVPKTYGIHNFNKKGFE